MSVFVVASLLGACGSEESAGERNQRIALELTTKLEGGDIDNYYDARRVDVVCSRFESRPYDCRAYQPVIGARARVAYYRVVDCGNGQWRAVADSRSSKVFATYIRHDTDTDLISDGCVKLDRGRGR